MGASTGISPILDYSGYATAGAALLALKDVIPNPDTTSTSGAQTSGAGSMLDEMSPMAATQLRVEIDAIIADLTVDSVAYGQHTVTAGEATANQADIVTGLADLTLASCAVTIRRSGTNVTTDAVLSEPTPGTLRVADGGTTYNVTAGDIITWSAR